MFLSLTRTGSPRTNFCHSCLAAQRNASTAASPIERASIDPSTSHDAPPSPLTGSSSQSESYKVKASVLLSRPPLLTRDLTPFEKAFFVYQRRLNERLALPFTRYFYYQRGTPGEVEWKRRIRERKTPARDIGPYNGYGEEAWNDELLEGDEISEPAVQIERLVEDAEIEVRVKGGEEAKKEKVEKPKSRWTEADERGETTSLNRLMTRTLYLLVKRRGSENRWMFPENQLLKDESLHKVC